MLAQDFSKYISNTPISKHIFVRSYEVMNSKEIFSTSLHFGLKTKLKQNSNVEYLVLDFSTY
jgi:hypothetical protein